MGLHRTYMPARIVESIIEYEVAETDETIYSAPYYNLREKGFFFYRSGYDTYVYVCEGRGTDQIMITTSKEMGWDRVSDEEYEKSAYIPPLDYRYAALYVLRELLYPSP